MARYSGSIESQATQLSGVNATTTTNGVIGGWSASATCGFKLRRVVLGCRTTTAVVPTSQQITIGVYRHTVIMSGANTTVVAGQALEIFTPQTDPTAGTIVATNTTTGVGYTLAATPLTRFTFNSQNSWDVPFELLEELQVNLGVANGLVFVNLNATLPTNHTVTIGLEIEV